MSYKKILLFECLYLLFIGVKLDSIGNLGEGNTRTLLILQTLVFIILHVFIMKMKCTARINPKYSFYLKLPFALLFVVSPTNLFMLFLVNMSICVLLFLDKISSKYPFAKNTAEE